MLKTTFCTIRRALVLLALFACGASCATSATADSVPQELIDVGGYRMNSVYLRASHPDLPPVVFVHGASANLFDPMLSFRGKLEGRADLLFVDRPGYGRSDRGGAENAYPDGQADAIAAVMDKRGIRKAIIVGHSFGGAVVASFALRHPDKVIGLVFLSPAVYPWPGGIAWYYRAASTPVTGWLFSTLIAPPAGVVMIDSAVKGVFAPNVAPADYVAKTHALMAIRPGSFHNNAVDVANLKDWTAKTSPRYPEIEKPTIIITGDTDSVVSPTIHAGQLAKAISGARLISIHNMGHKSDYVASDVAVGAIETLGGEKRDLSAIARRVEAGIANDREK
ncbi:MULTISPECIES: alpha/beta fold hydrolase [Rhizobium]|uniref:Alpha/beta hydrolase n=1 Tax=Rhizobium rhododendri TaxID=2506430 RepID=A0ABY8IFL3_9HYPH|nr:MULTISPECIES: alpha/beta hydrolase [Rhizobium]MBZ5759191.1 alpha/beta hydrolase [Rhizobium sp. VS19-DR96]MBZ5763978.1 alpha/beta hydrolase [Rhizobium sp. VS19-DR129.2]MBZ5771522.1 alpha/beta hydrolase [Rhizobium sp. VS19-DRK62.2]MBZ5783791.1 alpha/beta hydrolase [Rhizobium sp. VS19-DR121]MBZ5801535.1 alpha/beta hydrolase [Rhizobium sp. VS19-DR181]